MNRIMSIWILALVASLASPAAAAAAPAAAADRAPVFRRLAAPTSLTADAGDAQVTLTWHASEGAASYMVFRWTAASGETVRLASGVTALTFVDKDVANGAVYRYWVRASRGALTSAPSAEAAVRPEAPKPGDAPLVPPSALVVPAAQVDIPAASSAAVAAMDAGPRRDEQPAVNAAVASGAAAPKAIAAQPATAASALLVAMPKMPKAPPSANAMLAPPAPAAAAAPVQTPVVPNAPAPAPPAAAPAPAQVAAPSATTPAAQPVEPIAPAPVIPSVAAPSGPPPVARPATLTAAPPPHGAAAMTSTAPVATSTPVAPAPNPVATATLPLRPRNLMSTAGDSTLMLSWTAVSGATSYNIYRGLVTNGEVEVAATSANAFVDGGLANGTTYYYRVSASNASGESPRSSEISNSPIGPPAPPDPATVAAFRFLRQASWGPRPGDVDVLAANGIASYLATQIAATPSTYPDSLMQLGVEDVQEYFMTLALTAPDQLRQRVEFALHKIMVVSAVEVSSTPAIVTYHRILLNGAFGNFRDLMRDITLNPAMGRYLNMLNSRSQAVTGSLPNENYARELMQLFTIGIPKLHQNGTPVVALSGANVTTYTEQDVKELARILTGWTFGDGDPNTIPTCLADENYEVPMEAVASYHDSGQKIFLKKTFPAGQTARQDLDQALDLLFNHPNVGPFIGRQLIQQLVTSNPSPQYIADVAAVFNNNGAGVRGDLGAVIAAILSHHEAAASTPISGKLSEPVLYVASVLRALGALVTDHPFMSNKTEDMGQKVLYPASVFSYFSPGYRVRGTTSPSGPLAGPEFQILTSVTALERANFLAELLGGWYGTDVTVDYSPFTSIAADSTALVDYCSRLFMGGRMSPEARMEIINAVRVTPASNPDERVRTALYLTLTSAEYQVDR